MLSGVLHRARPIAQEQRIVGYDGPRLTIVVVDDNDDHRELMREVLAAARFRRADGRRAARNA